MAFEEGCKAMYEKVFSDADPTAWLDELPDDFDPLVYLDGPRGG